METLRRDAARTRSRLVDTARSLVSDGELPGLNAIARAADVGVGTVYRHFATIAELEEAMAWDQFEALAEILNGAGQGGLERALTAHFALLLDDPIFERVIARPTPALQRTSELQATLIASLGELMTRSTESGHLRPGVDASDVLLLLCGVAHSARIAGVAAASRQGSLMLSVILDGLRATGPAAS